IRSKASRSPPLNLSMSRASGSDPSAGRLMLLSAHWTRPRVAGFRAPSAPLPADPLGGVLEEDPLLGERDTDPVRLGEVPGLAGFLAAADHGVDLLVQDHGGPVEDPQDAVEALERRARRRHPAGAGLFPVERRVRLPDHPEDRPDRSRDVEI